MCAEGKPRSHTHQSHVFDMLDRQRAPKSPPRRRNDRSKWPTRSSLQFTSDDRTVICRRRPKPEAEATNDTVDRLRYYISTCQKNVKAANHVEEEDNYRENRGEGRKRNRTIPLFPGIGWMEGASSPLLNAMPFHYPTATKSGFGSAK